MIISKSRALSALVVGVGAAFVAFGAGTAHADDPAPPPLPANSAPAPAQDPLNAYLQSPDAPLTTDGDVLSEDIYIIL